MNANQQNEGQAIKVFCGVQPLSRRLSMLVRMHTCNELAAMVDELALLDAVLKRLQYDRDLFDECDLDQAIDRLRRGPEGGA
ncbi:MAG: hypothetical protein AB7U29_04220 [Desulfobulbus sp.]